MPIHKHEFENRDDDGTSTVRPGTNAYELLQFLLHNEEYAFTPKELSEETEVAYGSVSKTLSRLADRDLVVSSEEYWKVTDDESRIAMESLKSHSEQGRESREPRREPDWYDEHPDWADDLEDLGENT